MGFTKNKRLFIKETEPASEKSLEFCRSLGDFCMEHNIATRKLSAMCDGEQNNFRKTQAHRFISADPTLRDEHITRLRPIIAAALVRFLDDKGFTASEIEAELSPIFDTQEFQSMLANRCELTPEATKFFNLKYDPFDVDRLPAADEIFSTPELDSVVKRVTDAILYQRFVAVIGAVGSGKTLLKMRVAHELQQSRLKTKLLYPEFFDMEEVSVGGIAMQILAELHQKVPQQKTVRVNRIREVLTSMQQEDIRVALLMDECHRLSDKVISSLKNFWEMNNGAFSRLMGVVLFGQPAFVDARLRDVKFKEIRQRVQIIEMPDFHGAAQQYLAHRIQLAGGDISNLFDQKAVDKICQNAQTPLALGNLTNEALMEAYALDETKVSANFKFFTKMRDTAPVLAIRSRAS